MEEGRRERNNRCIRERRQVKGMEKVNRALYLVHPLTKCKPTSQDGLVSHT